MIFKELAKKLSDDRKSFIVKGSTFNPMVSSQKQGEMNFRKHLSQSALNLYEREKDIKKFTDLALSTPLDSDDKYIDMLFESGVVDPLDDETLMNLASNKKLLTDLGL